MTLRVYGAVATVFSPLQDDRQRGQHGAPAVDQAGKVVPVDAAGVRQCERAGEADPLQLLDTPGVGEVVLGVGGANVLRLAYGFDDVLHAPPDTGSARSLPSPCDGRGSAPAASRWQKCQE